MTPIDPATLSTTQRPQSGVVTPLNRTQPAHAAPQSGGVSSQDALTGVTRPIAGVDPVVDAERVAQIRKAVENGTYPILPYRIADAMIAAGYLLRAPK